MFIKSRLGMIEGAEAMLAHQQRMNQIANNMANVDTAGYKKEDITFWEMMFTAEDNNPRVGKALKVVTDHQQGPAEMTDNNLDFAIDGPGFFKIQTPDGFRYTRNGNFTLNGEGQLSTFNGDLVMGDGGAVVLEDDNIQVGRDGLITANGVVVNQLSLVTFEDLSSLEKQGPNLFRLKDENAPEQAVENPSLRQGYLEGANVNIGREMTEMIDLQRAYQTQQKTIQTIDDLDQQSISKVGNLTG